MFIVVKGEILRPRELTPSEITQILAYFNAKDSALVSAIVTQDIYRNETELVWVKVMVFGVPVLLGSLSAYFLVDNGRNTAVTMISLLLPFLLIPLLLTRVNRWKRRLENK